ncbi:MAG: sigma-70 family RNA polymerase sigma factor [Ktedonobacteraceae bacterium]
MPTTSTPFERETSVLSPELSKTQRPHSAPETPPSVTEEQPEQAEQRLLVMRARQGDQKAFGAIVDQYSAVMLRTATMILMDRDIAEDVVQDALIQAWHHLSDLRDVGVLRPWLMRIVVNQCLSFKRRLARTTTFVRQTLWEQERDLTAQIADHHKGRLERDWDLAHVIEALPAKQRVVIVLHYYHGMTLPQMAHVLQTPENTLKKRSQAALNNLRRVLRFVNRDEGMV